QDTGAGEAQKPSSSPEKKAPPPSSGGGALTELRIRAALVSGDLETARTLLKTAKGLEKLRLARLQGLSGQADDAKKTAADAAGSSRQQAPELATAIHLLNQYGDPVLAGEHFEKLRTISADLDLD